MNKNELRKNNKQKRNSMDKTSVCEKSILASANFLDSSIYAESRVLMLYMPLGNETDTAKIWQKALSDGKRVVFPVTDTQNNDIIPYYADGNTEFESGAFSIFEPQNAEKADEDEIDTVIVPGIAFSKSGARVGFGKGFYDRFLVKSNAVKVGYCYQYQICDRIETDEHDISMDYIVSENGVICCSADN